MLACYDGHKEVVALLVNEYKCDVNRVNKDGRNGFVSACYDGFKTFVKLLVNEYKCDVNHVAKDGMNGFMWACENGHKEVVALLVNEYKCDIRFMNKLKKSAFDFAETREIKSLILQHLHLDDSFLDKTGKYIEKHLLDRDKQSIIVRRTRLLLVGDGRAGKHSFHTSMTRLITLSFSQAKPRWHTD
jgi:ankyrin repeat protein